MTSSNRLNPAKGKYFQEKAAGILSKYFKADFDLDFGIEIGNPPKKHCFDLVSKDRKLIGECKNYSWTTSGNVPSAKMGFVNEAVFYLSFLHQVSARFVVMRKDTHPEKTESLADYYYRTYKHLLNNIFIIEIDLNNNSLREIGKNIE